MFFTLPISKKPCEPKPGKQIPYWIVLQHVTDFTSDNAIICLGHWVQESQGQMPCPDSDVASGAKCQHWWTPPSIGRSSPLSYITRSHKRHCKHICQGCPIYSGHSRIDRPVITHAACHIYPLHTACVVTAGDGCAWCCLPRWVRLPV